MFEVSPFENKEGRAFIAFNNDVICIAGILDAENVVSK